MDETEEAPKEFAEMVPELKVLAQRYRVMNVHGQAGAVVAAAKVVAAMDKQEAKDQAAAFVQETGYPADAFEREVAKVS